MLRKLNERLVRLAFPIRSAAVDTLVDTDEERIALRAIQNATVLVANDPRAYVEWPFQHPSASRFSNGSYGVLYVANSLATATRETAYHIANIYRDGNAPAMETRRMQLALQIDGRAEDIRRAIEPAVSPTLYDPHSYAVAQEFGIAARARADAVHYDSVRNRSGGRCVGAFTPAIVRAVRIVGQTGLVWNGTRFVEEYSIRPL